MDSGADNTYYYFYEAIDPYDDNKATDYRVIAKVRANDEALLDDWFEEVKSNNERNNTSIYESIDEYENARKEYKGNHSTSYEQFGRNGQGGSLHQSESKGNGERHTQRGGSSKQSLTKGKSRFS